MKLKNRSESQSNLKKSVYVIIRYSIFSSRGGGGWVIQKKNEPDKYKEELFSEKRMSLHEHLFETLTFPSIQKNIDNCPKDVDIKFLIITSESLPNINRIFLDNICKGVDNIKILPIDEYTHYTSYAKDFISRELKKGEPKQGLCATVRLDDDDALSDDFITQLNQYLDIRYSNTCISFGKGCYAYHVGETTNKITIYSECYYPKSPQGMSYVAFYDFDQNEGIDNTVFSIGSHTKIDFMQPLILDSRRYAYIYSIHEESDVALRRSGRGKGLGRVLKSNSIYHHTEVGKHFSWISENDCSGLSMIRLITYHGKFVCFDKSIGKLFQADLEDADKYETLYLDKMTRQIKVNNGSSLAMNQEGKIDFTNDPGESLVLEKCDGENRYAIYSQSQKMYLSAQKNNKLKLVDRLKGWEKYILC